MSYVDVIHQGFECELIPPSDLAVKRLTLSTIFLKGRS
jgi:hypothetical protein